MKFRKQVFTIVFLISLGGLFSLQAQETFSASGGEATGGGGSSSITVGQVVNNTNTGINGISVAEGVQQPYEISEVIGIEEEAKDINLICEAYPNPVLENLNLRIDASTSLSIRILNYKLYDLNGKVLEGKKLTSNETSISMKKFVSATYFLKVYENQKVIKTFKIIKN